MVLSPEEAGMRRALTGDEQMQINKAVLFIDLQLKTGYDQNPIATAISVDISDLKLSRLIETKIRVMYEDKGWSVTSGTHMNSYYLIFTPKKR